MYSFTGYNVRNGHLHVRKFTDSELHLGLMIRSLRSFYGLYSPHESLINSVLYINLISSFCTYWCVNNNNNYGCGSRRGIELIYTWEQTHTHTQYF